MKRETMQRLGLVTDPERSAQLRAMPPLQRTVMAVTPLTLAVLFVIMTALGARDGLAGALSSAVTVLVLAAVLLALQARYRRKEQR